jgi:hypothetical protein
MAPSSVGPNRDLMARTLLVPPMAEMPNIDLISALAATAEVEWMPDDSNRYVSIGFYGRHTLAWIPKQRKQTLILPMWKQDPYNETGANNWHYVVQTCSDRHSIQEQACGNSGCPRYHQWHTRLRPWPGAFRLRLLNQSPKHDSRNRQPDEGAHAQTDENSPCPV